MLMIITVFILYITVLCFAGKQSTAVPPLPLMFVLGPKDRFYIISMLLVIFHDDLVKSLKNQVIICFLCLFIFQFKI